MPSNELITSKFSRHSTAEDVIAGIDLTNRSVIVTGASSGIGADIARRRQNLGSRGTSPGPRRCHEGGRHGKLNPVSKMTTYETRAESTSSSGFSQVAVSHKSVSGIDVSRDMLNALQDSVIRRQRQRVLGPVWDTRGSALLHRRCISRTLH